MATLNDKLKTANVSIHVIATGAGAGIQKSLWESPGSSIYLSGGSFPYHPEETEDLLGFKPKSWASPETAIDLASVAYMKAFHVGDKNTVGLGLTASVASEKEHRADHRCHICVITNDRVVSTNLILSKGIGLEKRLEDGIFCDNAGLLTLKRALFDLPTEEDALNTQSAMERFLAYPFFAANGVRYPDLPGKQYALMSGAYNPPHEGHFGIQEAFEIINNKRVVYEITANPPHKIALSVQNLLQRAALLKGHDTLFTWNKPKFLDKARTYPGMPLVLGADAMLRVLDPSWGLDIPTSIDEFFRLGTHFYVHGRLIGDKFITAEDIILPYKGTSLGSKLEQIVHPLAGRHDISSTDIRSKVSHG